MSQRKSIQLTRRDFMKISMGVAASAVAFPLLVGCDSVGPTPTPAPTPNDNFPQPKTISSVKGVLETTLLIKMQYPPAAFTPQPPSPAPTHSCGCTARLKTGPPLTPKMMHSGTGLSPGQRCGSTREITSS